MFPLLPLIGGPIGKGILAKVLSEMGPYLVAELITERFRVHEEEETKREAIRAELEAWKFYLEKRFRDQRELREKLFRFIEERIEKGDRESVERAFDLLRDISHREKIPEEEVLLTMWERKRLE